MKTNPSKLARIGHTRSLFGGNLRRMMQFAESFPNLQIVSPRRWRHN